MDTESNQTDGVTQGDPEVPPFRMRGPSDLEQTIKIGAESSASGAPMPALAQRHEVGSILGRGGMGSVFLARQVDLDRDVAMKVMVSRPNSAATEDRFRREAVVLAKLAHPNIVPIYEMGHDENGRPYYTMKLVKGRTLQEILNDLAANKPEVVAAYPLNTLLTVFVKICDALAFAHSQGVLHRDLKPANIMVGEFGEVLVMDWGLAKFVDTTEEVWAGLSTGGNMADIGLTLTGDVIGTPQYMSPEQANGDVRELDQRSDVFSLGSILYAILTLHPPVDGTTPESVLTKVRTAAISPPSLHVRRNDARKPAPEEPGISRAAPALPPQAHARKVPEPLSAVTMKALQLDRDKRYQSVAELQADVNAYMNGFATSAEQAGTLRQLHLFMMRHKVLAFSTAAIAVLTVAYLVMVMRSERRAQTSAKEAIKSADSARSARLVAEERSETARKALARSQTSLAEAAYREFDSGAMLKALQDVPEDLRESDWRYLRSRADNSQAVVSYTGNQNFFGVAAHPTQPGVFVSARRGVSFAFIEARSGRVLREFPGTDRQRKGGFCLSVALSADGSRLIAGVLNDGGVAIYDTTSGRPLVEWEARETVHVRFSHDGRRTLEISDTALNVRQADTGKPLWRRTNTIVAAEFTPQGNVVAAMANVIEVLDGATGDKIRSLPRLRSPVYKMVLSPDGSVAYAACRDCVFRGIRLNDGAVVFEQRLAEGLVYLPYVAVSGDGSRLLGAVQLPGHFRVARLWDTLTGARVDSLMGGHGAIEGIGLHPLTSDVFISGPDTRIWNLASRRASWSFMFEDFGRGFGEDENLIMGRRGSYQLDASGRVERHDYPLSSKFAGADYADSAGDLTVVFKRQGVYAASIAVLRRQGTSMSLVSEFDVKEGVQRARISPDGRLLVLHDPYVRTRICDVTSGAQICRADLTGVDRTLNLRWLGSGRLIAIATRGERGASTSEEHLRLLDATTGKVLRDVINPVRSDVLAVAPDTRTFAEAGEDKRVRIRDAETLAIVREFRAHDGPITSIAFHPTQPLLATGSLDLSARLWRLDDLSLVETIRPSGIFPKEITFSPGGSKLVYLESSGGARIFDIATPPPGRYAQSLTDSDRTEPTVKP